ncbi:hypothetical protein V4889_12360 [Ralstonia solanacearum species complex bacterium KE101]|nr:hypothetical protein [Ralstonia pseudosolanacearum]QKL55176.1 hypothetical protein HI814_02155 [Ralstonia solanacearum]MCK4129179.1 hypothetical protein [Ralstonia pseudosolanacearum]QKL60166.1 hypothetical protein HI812_01470 [Ralstonia solanacearum]QKL64962.1 hypothetical protein HI808_01470 [Ralstonia solanacearum]QKL90606.1 hypothetical protein HI802_01560 [Ralstonia solanacearum]
MTGWPCRNARPNAVPDRAAEPALILTMGIVVLLIVPAVLIPIIEINQLVH